MKTNYISADFFAHSARDPWRWRAAQPQDVPAICELIERNSGADSQGITEINPVEGSRNVMHAIVNQTYAPKSELISVAALQDGGELAAINWGTRNNRLPWSTEEYVMGKFTAIERTFTGRIRMALAVQSILQLERWGQVCECKFAVNTSMRRDWSQFMAIHQRLGWTVRGSTAYKRLTTISFSPETGRIILP